MGKIKVDHLSSRPGLNKSLKAITTTDSESPAFSMADAFVSAMHPNDTLGEHVKEWEGSCRRIQKVSIETHSASKSLI